MNRHHLFFIINIFLSSNAFAAATPAATAATAPARATVVVREAGGSTIIGEQDSAMGLTLMPWKDEYATGLDQPPSLYRAPTSAVDPGSLQRQTEYRDNLGSYRRSHSQYTP